MNNVYPATISLVFCFSFGLWFFYIANFLNGHHSGQMHLYIYCHHEYACQHTIISFQLNTSIAQTPSYVQSILVSLLITFFVTRGQLNVICLLTYYILFLSRVNRVFKSNQNLDVVYIYQRPNFAKGDFAHKKWREWIEKRVVAKYKSSIGDFNYEGIKWKHEVGLDWNHASCTY